MRVIGPVGMRIRRRSRQLDTVADVLLPPKAREQDGQDEQRQDRDERSDV